MTGDLEADLSPVSQGNGMTNGGSGSDNVGVQAPNVIIDGKCRTCDTDIDLQAQGISCFSCKTWFHGNGCSISEELNVCPKSMFVHVTNAISKSGKYAKRLGRFLFICDHCDTEHEKRENVHMNDRVEVLDKKFSSFQTSITSQLNDLKDMMLTKPFAANHPAPQAMQQANPWDDRQRAARLRQVITISKDPETGETIDPAVLEKTCKDNGVRVVSSFAPNKSDKVAYVLQVNSKSDADRLEKSVHALQPKVKVDQHSAKTPRITIVGLESKYDMNELSGALTMQNPGISAVMEGESFSADDKLLKVVAVIPLHKDPNRFKAIVRVSNLIRSVIAKQQDRLYIGSQSCCKVYDNYFVLRCYNCQELGHHSESCEKTATCAHCAGGHETRSCQLKNNPLDACCNNCKSANLSGSDIRHAANDPNCPATQAAQKKLRNSVPFYRDRDMKNP